MLNGELSLGVLLVWRARLQLLRPGTLTPPPLAQSRVLVLRVLLHAQVLLKQQTALPPMLLRARALRAPLATIQLPCHHVRRLRARLTDC